MKRIWAVLLASVLLLSGCGKDTKTDGDANSNAAAIKLGNATVYMGDELTAEQKAALGDPVSTQQAPSCHYEGMDTVYMYEGFSLQTYRQGDADILCMAEITADTHETAKGIKVGSAIEAVKTAHGEPSEETEYYLVYELTEQVTLTFNVEEGVVTAILYEELA